MSVYRLDTTLRFPSVGEAAPDGLLAVGGDLRPERLLKAYSRGIFPWPHDRLPLLWFSPDPRMVAPPSDVRASRSLRARIRRGDYEVRFDTDFRGVIEGCASVPRPGQDGTWIDDAMVAAYTRLHRLGFAHSVETWRGDELVGGLYGVSLGGMFFGESMFSRATDASKVAFVSLARRLEAMDFLLIDCQMHTEHLESMGAGLRSRVDYLATLRDGLRLDTLRGTWIAHGDGLAALPMAAPATHRRAVATTGRDERAEGRSLEAAL